MPRLVVIACLGLLGSACSSSRRFEHLLCGVESRVRSVEWAADDFGDLMHWKVLDHVEDVIFDRRPDATERLVAFAETVKGQGKKREQDLGWRDAPVCSRAGSWVDRNRAPPCR